MKILLALRLYTGLEDSVISNSWSPKGVPTIYKLLEVLEKHHEIKVLLLHKQPKKMQYTKYEEARDREVKFKEFKNTFKIISSFKNKRLILSIFGKALQELVHFIKIIFQIFKVKPDLIYIDNANVWSAGIIARIFNKPVVLRLLGIYPYINKLSSQKINYYEKILRWCFKAPYSLVINTNDGSGKSSDLLKLLNPKTNVVYLLNGVDIPINSNLTQKTLIKNIGTNSTVCLFIGKLEIYKGCITFVESIIKARQKGIDVHAIIIGVGSEKEKLIKKINMFSMKNYFTILGEVNHKEIFEYHKLSDLYISLNHYGNLSNTNLEAIKFEQVAILPKNLKSETDREDIKLLGETGVLWIKDPNDIKGIIDHIETISSDKTILEKYIKNVKTKAELIPSWKDRIKKEVDILQGLVRND